MVQKNTDQKTQSPKTFPEKDLGHKTKSGQYSKSNILPIIRRDSNTLRKGLIMRGAIFVCVLLWCSVSLGQQLSPEARAYFQRHANNRPRVGYFPGNFRLPNNGPPSNYVERQPHPIPWHQEGTVWVYPGAGMIFPIYPTEGLPRSILGDTWQNVRRRYNLP